jgi:hypothetical protein
MPDRSKGTGKTKCSSWSSRLDVDRKANDPIPKKFTVTKPPESMEGVTRRRPRATQGCSANKEVVTVLYILHTEVSILAFIDCVSRNTLRSIRRLESTVWTCSHWAWSSWWVTGSMACRRKLQFNVRLLYSSQQLFPWYRWRVAAGSSREAFREGDPRVPVNRQRLMTAWREAYANGGNTCADVTQQSEVRALVPSCVPNAWSHIQ